MNVLIVNTAADQGGAAAIAKGLYESLKSQANINVVFISGRKSVDSNIIDVTASKFAFMLNVLMFRLLSLEGVINGKNWLKLLDKYLLWADVVHLHNTHGYYMSSSVLRKLVTRPTIWTLHDYWILTGRCASPGECDALNKHCQSCTELGRYPSAWFNRAESNIAEKRTLISNKNITFVAPSNTARQSMITMGIPKDRINVIENPIFDPVDVNLISDKTAVRKSLFLPVDKKIILFVSNIVEDPGKGFSVLESAFNQLENPLEWHLVVIGNASRTIPLREKENVVFLARISDRKILSNYFIAADVFVNPSYSETFGLVNIEALSCGCPVVCSDLPVFKELDQGGMTFFEKGNVSQLAGVLNTLDLDLLQLNNRMQIALAVRERFSQEKISEKYISLYNHAIGSII